MPNTLIGLLVFIVLLMPGFAFTLRRERHTKAERRFSAFRETIAIAFVSVIANSVAIGVFYLFRLWLPEATPDLDQLMNNGSAYVRSNYWDLCAWAALLLTVATIGAYCAASPRLADAFFNPFLSGWSIMFYQNDKKDVDVYVGCTLTDGSYVGGYLLSQSRLSDDSPDRDIALTGEITYRPAEDDGEVILEEIGGVILSARNILMMTVSYVERGTSLDPSEENSGHGKPEGDQ